MPRARDIRPGQLLRLVEGRDTAEVLAAADGRRLLGELWAAQRRDAPWTADRLLGLAPARREPHIRRCRRRLLSRPLVAELLARSLDAGFRDPAEARHLADLAWAVTEGLQVRDGLFAGGMAGLFDLQAVAQAHRGNACRLAADFAAARAFFERAYAFLARGAGAPEVVARVLSLHVSLLLDTSQARQALERVAEAEVICRRMGDREQLGLILLQRASAHHDLGERAEALQVQRAACQQLQGIENPRLAAAAIINLGMFLCELGRHGEAQELFSRYRGVFEQCREEKIHLLKLSVSAAIYQGLGEPRWARRFYLEARKGFLKRRDAHSAALVSLYLAGLYLEQGQPEAAARDAAAIHPVLREHELLPEAGAAFLLFVEAARQHTATAELAREMVERLRRLRAQA